MNDCLKQNVASGVMVQQVNNTMAKKRERSDIEYLRSTIKSQRSIIKHLKKELGRQQKREYLHDDLEERLADQMIEEEKQEELDVSGEKCPECHGKVEILDLGARKAIFCECGYRRTRKS